MNASEVQSFVLHHHIDKAKRVDGMIHSKNVSASVYADRMSEAEIQWRRSLETAADNYVRLLTQVKRAVKEGTPFLQVVASNATAFVNAITQLYQTAELRRQMDPNDLWFGETLALVENLKADADQVVAFLNRQKEQSKTSRSTSNLVPVVVTRYKTVSRQ